MVVSAFINDHGVDTLGFLSLNLQDFFNESFKAVPALDPYFFFDFTWGDFLPFVHSKKEYSDKRETDHNLLARDCKAKGASSSPVVKKERGKVYGKRHETP